MTIKESILELREQGLSYNQIVAELGCAKSTVSYYCGQDQRNKSRVRQKDKRSHYRRYIQEVKTSSPCVDCNIEYPYYIMDFDHRPDETKLFDISNSGECPSMDALLIEIAKCDLVCSNCHRQRSWERLVASGNSIP